MSNSSTISLLSVPNPILFLKSSPALSIQVNTTCGLTVDDWNKCIVNGNTFNDYYNSIKTNCNECNSVFLRVSECNLNTEQVQVLQSYHENVCVTINERKCWEEQWNLYIEKGQTDIGSYKTNAQLSYTCDACTKESMLSAIKHQKLLQKLFKLTDYGENQIKNGQDNIKQACGVSYEQIGSSSPVKQEDPYLWMYIAFPIVLVLVLLLGILAFRKWKMNKTNKNYARQMNQMSMQPQTTPERYYYSDALE